MVGEITLNEPEGKFLFWLGTTYRGDRAERKPSPALRVDAKDLRAAFRQDAELAAEILRRALNLVAGRVQATEAKVAEFCGVRALKKRLSGTSAPLDSP